MTRRHRWVAIVVIVVLGVATTVLLSGHKWFGTSCDIPETVAPNEGSADAPRGGLRVVEQGFTQPVDEFNSVSLGAVLENPHDQIAYHTQVTVRLLDAQGAAITGFESATDEIPIIGPGQRIGVGMTVSPTKVADLRVAKFEVETRTSQWLAGNALGDDFGLVSAEYQQTVRRDPEVPNSTEIRFVPQSTACRPLSGANPAAIFRDTNGTLVGGTRQYTVVTEACSNFGQGTWVIPRKAIPPADDSRTQLYPYCDIR